MSKDEGVFKLWMQFVCRVDLSHVNLARVIDDENGRMYFGNHSIDHLYFECYLQTGL